MRTRYRFDKLMKEVHPTTQEVWKYTPFPAGTLPKMMVKKSPESSYFFVSTAPAKKTIHELIDKARALTTCSMLFIVKAQGDKVLPNGVALVANKPISVPAAGEHVLM